MLHNEITSIIDRLTSPSKGKPNTDADSDCDHYSDDITKVTKSNEIEQEALPESHNQQPDFIESMQTDMVSSTVETMVFATDVEKYRQMIPYNTTDPDRISQQESILELLISNGICDDETFKIFIAEPDLHKEKASQILDSLYCVDTMMPIEYENDSGPTEWLNSVESIPPMPGSDSIAIPALTNSSDSIETNLASPPNPPLNTNTIDQEASSEFNHPYSLEYQQSTFNIIIYLFQALRMKQQQKRATTQQMKSYFQYSARISMQKMPKHQHSMHLTKPQKNGFRLAINNINWMLVKRNSVCAPVHNVKCNTVFMSQKMNYCTQNITIV